MIHSFSIGIKTSVQTPAHGSCLCLCQGTFSTLCSPSTTKGYPPQRFCETALQEGFPPQRTVEGVSQRVIDEACFARQSVGGVPPLKGTVEVGSEYSVPKTAVRNASVSPPQLLHRVAVRAGRNGWRLLSKNTLTQPRQFARPRQFLQRGQPAQRTQMRTKRPFSQRGFPPAHGSAVSQGGVPPKSRLATGSGEPRLTGGKSARSNVRCFAACSGGTPPPSAIALLGGNLRNALLRNELLHRNATVSQRASGICSRGRFVRRRCKAKRCGSIEPESIGKHSLAPYGDAGSSLISSPQNAPSLFKSLS